MQKSSLLSASKHCLLECMLPIYSQNHYFEVMPCVAFWEIDTLRKIIAQCEAGGAMVQELCEFGDKHLNDETAKVFKKEKDMKKGNS